MARKQALKVFRTPIGFHDAYVAAPSRKAALAAWGSSADLFARGVAEQVTDEALMRAPLAAPGTVIRRLRGSDAEQLAAAESSGRRAARRSTAEATEAPKTQKVAEPRPSRRAVDAAEAALADAERRQRDDEVELRRREDDLERLRRELARDRRTLERRHAREVERAEAAVATAKADYDTALDRWRTGHG